MELIIKMINKNNKIQTRQISHTIKKYGSVYDGILSILKGTTEVRR